MLDDTGVEFRPAFFSMCGFLAKDLEREQLLAVIVEQRFKIDQLFRHKQTQQFPVIGKPDMII